MAFAKSFFINNGNVPDMAISQFLTDCEKEHYINARAVYIPAVQYVDTEGKIQISTPRLTIIVTKFDEKE